MQSEAPLAPPPGGPQRRTTSSTRAQVAMIGLLLRHANVHTDASAVRRFDLLA